MIDPDKWDFYAMDCARVVGDNVLAVEHANEVMRIGKMADGSERWPMRTAEARITLAVVAARAGNLDEAINDATAALNGDRQCVPSLLMAARELDRELNERYPHVTIADEWQDSVAVVQRAAVEAPAD